MLLSVSERNVGVDTFFVKSLFSRTYAPGDLLEPVGSCPGYKSKPLFLRHRTRSTFP